MKRLIISLPDKGKWKLSCGKSKGKVFSSPGRILKTIYKSVLASELNEKTSVVIKEHKDIVNESVGSQDGEYLKYILNCFLEDYIPQKLCYLKKQ